MSLIGFNNLNYILNKERNDSVNRKEEIIQFEYFLLKRKIDDQVKIKIK